MERPPEVLGHVYEFLMRASPRPAPPQLNPRATGLGLSPPGWRFLNNRSS